MFHITKHILHLFLFLSITLFIISCEDTDDKQSIKQTAIALISNYANGTGQVPTLRNYEDAGIIGVNEKNINELNSFIETLTAEDIDTETELNNVINALGISIASDIFAPVITLKGPLTITLELGDTYTKACATAIDNRDGEVTVYVVGDVNTNKIGTYIVTYSAVDEANNLATVNRIITVVKKPVQTIQSYQINFTVTQDPYLNGINIRVDNTINGDTLSGNFAYSADNTIPVTFSLPLKVKTGDNYNITVTSPNPVSPQDTCYFPPSTITSGTMGNTNITLTINCPNDL